MNAPYTVKNLTEVRDVAGDLGVAQTQEVRFARTDLDAERVGFTLHRVAAGKRQAIGHRHHDPGVEEVYVVLSGSGRAKLDDEVLEIAPLDAIRVAPEVIRSFEGGPEGIQLLAFGPRHDGDGEVFPGWWND